MTELATLTRLDDGTYTFTHGGIEIRDPLTSECGRFEYDPVDGTEGPTWYGFEEISTGGGCTAWARDFLLPDGKKVVMMLTDTSGTSHAVVQGESYLIGLHGAPHTDDWGVQLMSWIQPRGIDDDGKPEARTDIQHFA